MASTTLCSHAAASVIWNTPKPRRGIATPLFNATCCMSPSSNASSGFDAVHAPIASFIHRRIGSMPHAQLDDDVDRPSVRGVHQGEEPLATQVTQPELDLSSSDLGRIPFAPGALTQDEAKLEVIRAERVAWP